MKSSYLAEIGIFHGEIQGTHAWNKGHASIDKAFFHDFVDDFVRSVLGSKGSHCIVRKLLKVFWSLVVSTEKLSWFGCFVKSERSEKVY